MSPHDTSCAASCPARRLKALEALALAAALVAFAAAGWGQWGYGVISDYELDLADALRVFQGDVPYRDFLPTYGPIHMLLVAPLFCLGRSFFPVLWTSTLALIFLQLLGLNHLARRCVSGIWRMAFVGLAVTAMAFAPTNSKFVMGYSQSGFLGSLMGTAALVLLGGGSPSRGRWALGGICLGLVPFTKVDLGLASVVAVVALGVVWWRPLRSCVVSLLVSYGLVWLAACLLLALWAGRWDLLLGSTAETFGQVGLFAEPRLAGRIKGLCFGGIILATGLSVPRLRPWVLRGERNLRRWAVLLLPAAIFTDAVRSALLGPTKQLVALNWLWTLAFVVVGAHLGSAVIRTRSLRPLRSGPRPLLVVLWVTTAMGLLRVLGSGWYPLNYFQPAPLLLGVLWLAPSRRSGKWTLPRSACWLLGLALLVQAGGSLLACRPTAPSLDRFATPFGEIAVPLKPEVKAIYDRILPRILSREPDAFLLCTYEPSWHLLTGMRSANFYTFFTRLGLSGSHLPSREREALALFRERRPAFIVIDREVGGVHRRFGVDYGFAMLDSIRNDYEEVERVGGTVLYRRKDLSP